MNAGKHVDDTRPVDDGEDRPVDDGRTEPADGGETLPTDESQAAPGTPRPLRADDSHVLPSRSSDDLDVGWGDRPGGDDDERFLRDVPPHWGR